MTIKEQKICDKCGEEIKKGDKDFWDEVLEPYHEVKIESKGMRAIASNRKYFSNTLHFHDNCIPEALKELSANY